VQIKMRVSTAKLRAIALKYARAISQDNQHLLSPPPSDNNNNNNTSDYILNKVSQLDANQLRKACLERGLLINSDQLRSEYSLDDDHHLHSSFSYQPSHIVSKTMDNNIAISFDDIELLRKKLVNYLHIIHFLQGETSSDSKPDNQMPIEQADPLPPSLLLLLPLIL
jgi:hypothetical protein